MITIESPRHGFPRALVLAGLALWLPSAALDSKATKPRIESTTPPAVTSIPQGNTYYVAPGGADDSPGTSARPFRTITRALNRLNADDTVFVRRGIYAESLDNNIPSGTSWSGRVALAACPGEEVILRPNPGSQFVMKLMGNVHHIIIDRLVLDGVNVSDSAVYIDNYSGRVPHHIRIQNCEVKNAPHAGVIVGASGNVSSDYHEFLSLNVHDNGRTSQDHGFYISGSHELIDDCQVHHNAGEGIQIYRGGGLNGVNASYNTVRNSKLHDNGVAGLSASIGLGVYVGDGNIAYNNLIWHNGIGIAVEIGATDTLLYNNTIYNSFGDAGVRIGYTKPRVRHTVVQNNIIYKSARMDIMDYGRKTVADHNLLNKDDPLFVDSEHNDFHVRDGSPAIDAGIALNRIRTAVDGVARPQGRGYDIGAYER